MKTESRLPRLVSSPPANTATSPPKPKKVVLELELENDEGKLRQMWQEESDEDVKRLIRKRMYTLREERVNNHGGLKQPQATCKSPNKNGSPTTSAKTIVKKSEVKTTSTMQSSSRSPGVGGSGSKLPRFAVTGEQQTKRTTVTTTTTVTSPTKPKQSRPSPSAIPTRTVTTSQDNSVKRKQAAAPESKLRSPTRYSPTKTKIEKTVISSPEPETPESPVDMMEYLDTNHPEDFTLTPEPSFEELEERFQMRTDDSDSPDFALMQENSRDEFEIRQTFRKTTVETKKTYVQHADSLKEFEMVERKVLQDDAQDFFNTSDMGFNRPQVTMPDDDADYPVNDVKVRVDDEDRVIIEEIDPVQCGTLIEEEGEESYFGKEESGSHVGKNVRRSPVHEDYQHVTTTTWKKTAIPAFENLREERISQEPIITVTKSRQVFASASVPVQVQESIPDTQSEIPNAAKIVKCDNGWMKNETSSQKVENSSFSAEVSINKKAETPDFIVEREETPFDLSAVNKTATPKCAYSMSTDHSEDSTETRTVRDTLLKKGVDAVELDVKTKERSPTHLKDGVNSQPEDVCRIVTLESVENMEVTESHSLLNNDNRTLDDLEIQKVVTPDSFATKQGELDVSEHSDKESINLVESSLRKEVVVTVASSVSKEQEEFAAAEPSKIEGVTTSEHSMKQEESVCAVSSPKKLRSPESPTNKESSTSESSTFTTTVASECLIKKKVETTESTTKEDAASIETLKMKDVDALKSIEQKEVEVLHNLSSSSSYFNKENDSVSRVTSPKKEVIKTEPIVVRTEIDAQTPSSKKEAEIQVGYTEKEMFTSTASKKKEVDIALHSKTCEDNLVQSLDKTVDLKKKDDKREPSWKKEDELLKEDDDHVPSWKKEDEPLKGDNQVPSWEKDGEPLEKKDDIQSSWKTEDELLKKDDNQVPSRKKEDETIKKKDDDQVPHLKKHDEPLKKKDDIQSPFCKKEDEPLKKKDDIQSPSCKKEDEPLMNKNDNQVPSWKKEDELLKKKDNDQVPSWKKENELKKKDDDKITTLKKHDEPLKKEDEAPKKKDDNQVPSWKKEDEPLKKKNDNQVPSWKKENELLKKKDDDQVPPLKKHDEPLRKNDIQSPCKKEDEPLKKDDNQVPSWKTEDEPLKKKDDDQVPSWKKKDEPLKKDDSQVPSWKKEDEPLKKYDNQVPSWKKEDEPVKKKDDIQVSSEKNEDDTQVSSGKSENYTRSQSWKKEVHSDVDSTTKSVEPLTIRRIVRTEFTVKREVDVQEPTKAEAEISEDSEKKELDAERKKVFEEARARFAAANSLLESSSKSSQSAAVLPERKQSFNEARAKFSSLAASQADESAKFRPSGRFTEVTKSVTSTTSSESYPVNRWNKPQSEGTQPPSLDSTPFRTFIVKRNSEDIIPNAPVIDSNADVVAANRKVEMAVSPNIPDGKVTTATISLSPSKVTQEQYRTYTVRKIHDDPFQKTSTATPTTITNETSRVYDTPKGRVTEVTHTTITSSSSTSSNADQTLDCQKVPQSPSSPTKSPTGFPWRNQEGAIGALVRKMSSQDVTTPPVMITQKTYVTRTSSSCSDKVTPVEDWQAMVLKRKMGLAAERAKEDENLLYTTAAMAPEDINDMALLEKMLNAASNYEQRRRIRAQMRVVKKNQEVLASADRDVTSERVVVQSRDYPKQLRSSFSSFTSASSGYSSASPSPDRERCFSPLTPDGVHSVGARNFHQTPENGDFDVSGEKLVCPDDSVTDDSGCYTSSISEQSDIKVSPFVDLLSDNMGDMYVSGVNLNDVHDEVHLHELLDSTEDYEDRKKIRARLKDVMAYNRAQREEMIKRREEEREEQLKNRVRDAEEQKRRTLAMYDAMAKSAPAGGHKTMDVNILREEMQDVKENLLPSNADDVHGQESALSCWQLVKSVQTQKLDADGSHVITTNACWSYSNGKSSGPSTPTLPDGKLDMVEEGIRQRVRESDERKKKILAAYDQAAKSGPAGAPRFVDFDNVNIENFDPQHNPPRFTSTVQIKGGIPITLSHGNSSPIVGPVHPKAHGYDPMEEAIRKRQREADERKRRTLEAYDKAQKSRPAGAPVSVYIPQADDVEPVVEITKQAKPVSAKAKFQQMDAAVAPKGAIGTTVQKSPSGPGLVRSATAIKEMIINWCKSKTKEYERISIDNFSTSWSDGLAFCALIHHFYPDAFDFDALSPKNRRHNFELAFRVAEEKADIAPLLDVEDMVMMAKPDWKCVFTYVQSIYRRLYNADK